MEQTANHLELSYWERIRRTLDMIKFEHSIFALPFALTGALLAWREANFQIEAPLLKLACIIVAMVSARSAAMTFNRLLDAAIDAKNPRTATRHIPAGRLTKRFAWGFLLATAAIFFLASALLNPLCLLLSPVALGVILFYSYTKRFTSFSHLVLGLSLGIAPAAAWIAMTGQLDLRMGWLTAAVMLWTAGFDIIYACQDFEFDLREGLFSIPARLGIARALWVSRALHLATVLCLIAVAQAFHLSPVAPAFVAALLLYEHSLVRATDLSRVNAAFFTVNGVIGAGYFAIHAIEVLLYVR
jgi:4-hydroxybenzoate polyprenyltransferase